MDSTQILSFVQPELIIIIVACYLLGQFIKAIPNVKNWLIPFILLAVAVILTILYLAIVLGQGFTAKVVIVGFIQGLLCASVAVYSNEIIKQLIRK
jgi:hypothetical protein